MCVDWLPNLAALCAFKVTFSEQADAAGVPVYCHQYSRHYDSDTFLLASLLSPNGLPLVILSLILLVGFAILSMIADYQFYWGLGETIVPNEYDFSEDRLHWAFYWKLIALPVVFLAELSKVPLLPTICSLIFSSLSLFILYQFSQVVQQKEE